MMKHEFVHVHQIRREGVLWFYAQYLFCVAKYYWKTGNLDNAFVENIWEDEAYGLQNTALSDSEVIEVGWTSARTDAAWKKQKRENTKAQIIATNGIRKSNRLLAMSKK